MEYFCEENTVGFDEDVARGVVACRDFFRYENRRADVGLCCTAQGVFGIEIICGVFGDDFDFIKVLLNGKHAAAAIVAPVCSR